MTIDWNPDSRTSFSVSETALEALDEIANREGKSRSEKLRELVKQEVEAKGDLEGPSPNLPEDEDLAEAYRILHSRAYREHKDHPRVSLKIAENKLFSNDTPKSAVTDELIKPLQRLGFVSVDPGANHVWITVKRMTYTDGSRQYSEEAPA